MLRRVSCRRLLTLLVAYGLALQALLSVGALPTLSSTDVICSGRGQGRTTDRAPSMPGHDFGCPVCPLACGGVLALPPGVAVVVRRLDGGEDLRPRRMLRSPVPTLTRAGLARAPPA